MDTTDSVQNRYIVLRTNTCRVAVCDEQSRIVAQRAVDARGIASSLRIATGLHVASTHGVGDHRAISKACTRFAQTRRMLRLSVGSDSRAMYDFAAVRPL